MNKKWTPEKVDQAFDDMRNNLGRMPYQKEFPSGALTCIKHGRYNQKVRTWGQYLEHRNSKPGNGRYVEDRRIGPTASWTNEMVDQAFDEMINRLGRTPRYKEFEKQYPGVMSFIRDGKYDKKISKWNQYVEHRNADPNTTSWDSERMDRAFDEMKTELGRTPTVTEFSKKYGGALDNIYDGRYDQNIRTWAQYLEHRGVSKGTSIKTPQQLQTLFEQEHVARLVAERFAQPEDVADILAVIYSGRIGREDLMNLLETPSLRDYLGPIRKPDIGIGELAEAGTHLLKLDKGGVIFDIIMRRAQEMRREILGPNPSPETRNSFLKKLETELHELVGA